MDLRSRIARELHDAAFAYAHALKDWDSLHAGDQEFFLGRSDRILAIPEIKDALAAKAWREVNDDLA